MKKLSLLPILILLFSFAFTSVNTAGAKGRNTDHPQDFRLKSAGMTKDAAGMTNGNKSIIQKESPAPVFFDDYEKDWRSVDSLYNIGLPKSALEISEKIYEKAKAENNQANFVRAIIYRIKLTQGTEEDDFFKSLDRLKLEEANAQQPVKQVLNSMLANVYWSYFQQNRYRFLNRTETVNFNPADIKTWDIRRITEQTMVHFKASLDNPSLLQSINIESYNEILNNYAYDKEIPNGRPLRPTLFDFLINRAIDFYSESEAGLTRPASQFLLNDKIFLSPAREFAALDISTNDEYSFDYQAIILYREAIKFHLNDPLPDALIDADLSRLEFVNSNSGNADREKLYLEALEDMQKKYSSYSASSDISFSVASVYAARGRNYFPAVSEEYSSDTKKAYDICRETAELYPNTIGGSKCKALMMSLSAKEVGVTVEEVSLPGVASKTLIRYKNINKLYMRVVETSEGELESLASSYAAYNYDYKKFQRDVIKKLSDKTPVHKYEVSLPGSEDLNAHTAEVKIPALGKGLYVLLAGTDENMSWTENAVAYTVLTFSDISYISKGSSDQKIRFYILSRSLGQPLAGAKATIYIEEYDYGTSKYTFSKGDTYETDRDGYFEVPPGGKYRRFYLDIEHNGDRLNTKGYELGYGYSYNQSSFYQGETYKRGDLRETIHTYFFLDRAIYRPGQIIYFKGITIGSRYDKSETKSEIKTNHAVTVQFYDVNYQKTSEQTFMTNDFGTFNGSFTAPTAGLNGSMHLQTADNTGSIYFNVEDYKRPKFEVTFEEIKGSYKLGEMVPVKGIAKSYAGANIDNAQVKYRVVRKAVFPRWWYWWGNDFMNSPEVEIANGNTQTDAEGKFNINFKAIPDEKVSKSLKPYYNYTIYADVTDVNGETHSSEKWVSVGYQSMLLATDIPEFVNKNGKTNFIISTTNLSGVKEPTAGTITIYKLKNPEKTFRRRLWAKPDKFIYSKEEYYRDFPLDEYNNELDYTKWEKEIKAYEKKFDTEADSTLNIDEIRTWNQGLYAVEMKAKDKFGEEVISSAYFTAYSSGEATIPYPTADWFAMLKARGEPGEYADMLAGTGYSNVRILVEIEGRDKEYKKEWMSFSNNQKLISIPLIEEYRGNISTQFAFIYGGRVYTHSQLIEVPRTDKMLDISYETFRDKLQPGQQEEWRLKIKGKNGEKAAAEFAATMYDASLDAFKPNYWGLSLYDTYSPAYTWSAGTGFGSNSAFIYSEDWVKTYTEESYTFDYLNWFGLYFSGINNRGGRYNQTMDKKQSGRIMEEQSADTRIEGVPTESPRKVLKETENKKKDGKGDEDGVGVQPVTPGVTEKQKEQFGEVVARKDFRETAFFMPELRTNEDGDVILAFKMPEALTKWKLLGFAHTKDLKLGFTQKEAVTQKDLMITPNVPRYFREMDKVVITSKVTNMTDNELSGEALLELFDALTMKPLDDKMGNTNPVKTFTSLAGQSSNVSWEINIPFGLEAVTYRIKAKSGSFTDGEESVLPVLSNRMMVTETLPLPIRGYQTKNFTLDKLVNNTSTSLTNYKLTLEFTSNPAWYAVQALPYLMEYPYECAEQTFSRIYANSIATHIANSDPKIKNVFDAWRTKSPDALLSNLEKNQELKSLALEESPWVLEAKNESERKRRISTLFEMSTMAMELGRGVRKLAAMQVSNGAWPWFEGMPEDRYITQHIVCGFGKLNHLGIKSSESGKIEEMTSKALNWLDAQIRNDLERLKQLEREGRIKLSDNNLGYIHVHYLYTRSFYKDVQITSGCEEAFEYFKGQAGKYWNGRGMYSEGLIALALNRYGEKAVPEAIVKSMREYAIINEELGMYWKDNTAGYYWYEAPIETQSLLIEVFDEVAGDLTAVDDMKVWLLKQKQTQDWKTTKATVEACYALLLRGGNWLATDVLADITLGGMKIDPKTMEDVKVEAGTGYFKTSWMYGDVKPEMGNVTVSKKTEGVSWGALYWQYFESIDKITKSSTPLSIEKKLFLEQNTSTGPVITPVNADTKLKPGDMIKVRVELRVDRDMEYVHMKDMRAAGFEPVNVISRYKYQDGLGYYESTRDAATNFFFGWLPKGTYVFEYPLRVNLNGDYSNGITTVQCMYAPEFTSHSEGIRVKIGD